MGRKTTPIKDIDTALRIFYTYPEIGNAEISELFGGIAQSTVIRYKEEVVAEQIKQDVKTSRLYSVNTRVAYEVWGLDVKDLEQRRKKLKELGM